MYGSEAALQKELYQWLILSGIEMANHFSTAVGLPVPPDFADAFNNPSTPLSLTPLLSSSSRNSDPSTIITTTTTTAPVAGAADITTESDMGAAAGTGAGTTSAAANNNNNSKPSWRRTQVQTLVTQPVPVQYFLGKHKTKEGLALVNNDMAVSIVKLLGYYGAMTNFQLRAILSGVDYERGRPEHVLRQRNSLSTKVFEALYHLRFAGADLAGSGSGPGSGSGSGAGSNVTPLPSRVVAKDVPVQDWEHGRGRPPKIWMLGDAGKLWYQMLTSSPDVPGANSATASVLLRHTYGVQQVLAGLRSLVNSNNQLETLPQLLAYLASANTGGSNGGGSDDHNSSSSSSSSNNSNTVVGGSGGNGSSGGGGNNSDSGEYHSSNTPATTQSYTSSSSGRFRMEVEAWAKSFPLSQTRPGYQGRLIPDAVGRIVVDSDKVELEQLLLAGAGLDPQLAINEFAHLPRYGQMTFPFFLEFDRNTETASVFAQDKYPKYADIYNAPATSAWLPQWGTKFGVVLVVTEGTSAHLLSLLKAVVQVRRANKQQKAFVYWWFTTTEWFSAAYRPYLDDELAGQWEQYLAEQSGNQQEAGNTGSVSSSTTSNSNSKRKVRKNGRKPVEVQPPLGHDPRCWLSLGAGAGVSLEEVVAVDRYYRAADPAVARPPLLAKMSALPLPHPLNMPPLSPPVA